MADPKPFVKWVGGKGNIVGELNKFLPEYFDELQNVTYIEPFVGGGAMLFYILLNHNNITRVVINDLNPDLIRCYQLVRDNPITLIDILTEFEEDYLSLRLSERSAYYYLRRKEFNQRNLNEDYRAALFMFLNRTCYNGLYRENSKGQYNVPAGKYINPTICNKEIIMADHELFNSINFVIRRPGDYFHIKKNLSKKYHNFIYLDPPYRPLNITSCFKEYSSSPFGDIQQRELKEFCDVLSQKRCMLMLSNSDSIDNNGNSFFDILYEGYDIQRIQASRSINANADRRKKQTEVLIRNY